MPYCDRCDSRVSDDYARVMGDNDGIVSSCPACHAPSSTPDANTNSPDREVDTGTGTATATGTERDAQPTRSIDDQMDRGPLPPSASLWIPQSPQSHGPSRGGSAPEPTAASSNVPPALNPVDPPALRCTVCGWPTRDGFPVMRDHLTDHGIETDHLHYIEEADTPTDTGDYQLLI